MHKSGFLTHVCWFESFLFPKFFAYQESESSICHLFLDISIPNHQVFVFLQYQIKIGVTIATKNRYPNDLFFPRMFLLETDPKLFGKHVCKSLLFEVRPYERAMRAFVHLLRVIRNCRNPCQMGRHI